MRHRKPRRVEFRPTNHSEVFLESRGLDEDLAGPRPVTISAVSFYPRHPEGLTSLEVKEIARTGRALFKRPTVEINGSTGFRYLDPRDPRRAVVTVSGLQFDVLKQDDVCLTLPLEPRATGTSLHAALGATAPSAC